MDATGTAGQPELPAPWDYCCVWDGAHGRRKLSAAPHEGGDCDRAIALFTAEQMYAFFDLGRTAGANGKQPGGAPAARRTARTPLLEAACLAYGLLWHECGTDTLVQRARMVLLDELSRDDQRHGIQAARALGAAVDGRALEAAMLRGMT